MYIYILNKIIVIMCNRRTSPTVCSSIATVVIVDTKPLAVHTRFFCSSRKVVVASVRLVVASVRLVVASVRLVVRP